MDGNAVNVALCKCGIDMSEHPGVNDFIEPGEHWFSASGTKHRCEELIATVGGVYLCPRPAYHLEHDVACGPLTGEKLWE